MPGRGIQFFKITQWVSFCFVFGEGKRWWIGSRAQEGWESVTVLSDDWQNRSLYVLFHEDSVRPWTDQGEVCVCEHHSYVRTGVGGSREKLRMGASLGEGCCFSRMKGSTGMCDNWVSRGGKDRAEFKMSNSPHLLPLVRQDELWTEGFSVTPYFCPILQLGEEILYLDV